MESADDSPMQQLTLVTIRATGRPPYIDTLYTHTTLCLGFNVKQKPAINLGFEKTPV